MLWVLKRIVSMRAPKTYVKTDRKENIYIFTFKILFILTMISQTWQVDDNMGSNSPAVQQHDRYTSGSIMVWASITYGQRMSLMIVQANLTGLPDIFSGLTDLVQTTCKGYQQKSE